MQAGRLREGRPVSMAPLTTVQRHPIAYAKSPSFSAAADGGDRFSQAPPGVFCMANKSSGGDNQMGAIRCTIVLAVGQSLSLTQAPTLCVRQSNAMPSRNTLSPEQR